jgi:predicted nucleic acid-binding Zn ribbon protein
MSTGRPRRRRAAPDLPPEPGDWVVAEDDEAHLTRVEGPTELGGELARLTRRPGWGERLGAARLDAAWPDIVGPELVAHCEPVRLAGRVLVVRAATPVWATQLRYLTAGLIARAEAVLGEGSVRDVNIVVGRLEGRSGPASAPPTRPPSVGHTDEHLGTEERP